MKQGHFTLLTVIAGFCLLLSFVCILFDHANQSTQETINSQQAELSQNARLQQTAMNALNNMAKASLNDEKMKQLLKSNGYTVNVKSPETPAK